jgi:hypothetical protein
LAWNLKSCKPGSTYPTCALARIYPAAADNQRLGAVIQDTRPRANPESNGGGPAGTEVIRQNPDIYPGMGCYIHLASGSKDFNHVEFE